MIPVSHLVISVGAQVTIGFSTGNWLAGGAAATGFFLGREIAQAEYRWIERYGAGKRANMPWYGRFEARVWDVHSLTDWLLPLIFTTAISALV